MSALDWCKLVAETVAEFAKTPTDQGRLAGMLSGRPGYSQAVYQHNRGATQRVLAELLRCELRQIVTEN